MKKVLSIVLAIAMIATMSAVAFAAEAPTGSVAGVTETAAGTAEFDVNGKFTAAAHVDKYKVDVNWSNTEFVYTEDATVWNTETHKWDVTTGATWAGEGTITVKNHSSKNVTATPTWEAAADGVVMTFTGEGALAACPVGAAEEAVPTATFTAKVTAGAITADVQIGTIVVTIA